MQLVSSVSPDRDLVVLPQEADVDAAAIKHDLDVVTRVGANLSREVGKVDGELVAQNVESRDGYLVDAVSREPIRADKRERSIVLRKQAQLVDATVVEDVKNVFVVEQITVVEMSGISRIVGV
ncbi:hypothetical protein D3C83_17500 [compost metagenome]